MELETTINGLSDLDKLLSEFPLLIQKKVLRGALRAGQVPMRDEAKGRAPIERAADGAKHRDPSGAEVPIVSGALRDSIRISVRTVGGTITATLKAGGKKAFYAHMVEYGTTAHFIQPKYAKALGFLGQFVEGVHHPGAQKVPFMRPALDNKQGQAIEAFAAYMRTRIDKENVKMLATLPDQTDQAPA